MCFNISKETTKKELISIEGVSEQTRRMQGINLSGGATNSVEFVTGLFNAPQMTTWLKAYRQQSSMQAVAAEHYRSINDSAGSAVALSKIKEETEEERV